MDVDAEDDDRQQRGDDLKEELGEGSDPVEVIENHQGGDDRRREEQPEGGRVGREQCRREAESQVHGEPAEAGRRPAVDTPLPGLRHRPQAECQPAGGQHGDRGEDQCDEKRPDGGAEARG